MRKRIAFTLAEVLITLGIIGVIAALLLHNIGINITKKEIATKVKKIMQFLIKLSIELRLIMEILQIGSINLMKN